MRKSLGCSLSAPLTSVLLQKCSVILCRRECADKFIQKAQPRAASNSSYQRNSEAGLTNPVTEPSKLVRCSDSQEMGIYQLNSLRQFSLKAYVVGMLQYCASAERSLQDRWNSFSGQLIMLCKPSAYSMEKHSARYEREVLPAENC